MMSIAFVFPGQGSQSVGMLKDIAACYPTVRETFAEASEVLGYDLWELTQQGPEAELGTTQNTQPAMLVAGVALWRIWGAQGGAVPARLAGHSLGEYTALVCGGALDFEDAVKLVSDRGRYMQEAVRPGVGAMAAILGLGAAKVAEICREAAQAEIVSCANYNTPGQVVIAGHTGAVERAVARAQAAGARRAVLLAVSVPSHCVLMRPAAEHLAERLRSLTLLAPALPVVHNVDLSMQTDPHMIARALVEQLYKPVRWTETVQVLVRAGVRKVVECGPGRVLAGLCKRIEASLACFTLQDPTSFTAALAQCASPSPTSSGFKISMSSGP